MKREILFRGKHKNTHTWVDGSYIKEIDPYDKTVKHYIMSGNKFSMHEVDPATVGQFTGLTDKNGVKIFEGDVVLSNTLSGKHWGEDLKEYTIGFYYGAYCFMIEGNPVRQWKDGTNDWYSIENNETFTLKVTGNIHDK